VKDGPQSLPNSSATFFSGSYRPAHLLLTTETPLALATAGCDSSRLITASLSQQQQQQAAQHCPLLQLP